MKAAKDESLAAAEVQSAFTVSPALLTAQMIKHFTNQIQAKNKIFLLYLVFGIQLHRNNPSVLVEIDGQTCELLSLVRFLERCENQRHIFFFELLVTCRHALLPVERLPPPSP